MMLNHSDKLFAKEHTIGCTNFNWQLVPTLDQEWWSRMMLQSLSWAPSETAEFECGSVLWPVLTVQAAQLAFDCDHNGQASARPATASCFCSYMGQCASTSPLNFFSPAFYHFSPFMITFLQTTATFLQFSYPPRSEHVLQVYFAIQTPFQDVWTLVPPPPTRPASTPPGPTRPYSAPHPTRPQRNQPTFSNPTLFSRQTPTTFLQTPSGVEAASTRHGGGTAA